MKIWAVTKTNNKIVLDMIVEENMIVIIGDTKIPPDKFSTLWALAGRAAQIRYELVMREQWWEQNSEAFLAQYQRE